MLKVHHYVDDYPSMTQSRRRLLMRRKMNVSGTEIGKMAEVIHGLMPIMVLVVDGPMNTMAALATDGLMPIMAEVIPGPMPVMAEVIAGPTQIMAAPRTSVPMLAMEFPRVNGSMGATAP
jgi:hypothetical protein